MQDNVLRAGSSQSKHPLTQSALGTEGKNEKNSVSALLRVTSSEPVIFEISIPWLHLRQALISGTPHFSSVTLQEIHNSLIKSRGRCYTLVPLVAFFSHSLSYYHTGMRTKKPPSPMWVFQLSLRYLQKIFIPTNLLGEVQANEIALANLICDCHVFKPFTRLKELFCKCFIFNSEQASIPGMRTQCDPPRRPNPQH